MKWILTIFGVLSLGLAIAGIFLPLLPTTPLLLLAAALFLRSSPRLYDWLINHPHLGVYIRNFREYRAIPLRVKIVSISMVWLTLGYCIVAVTDMWWLRILLLLLAIGISWHILSYTTLKNSGKE